jgi:hypothetical protein
VLRFGSSRQRPANAGLAAHAANGSTNKNPSAFQNVNFMADPINTAPAPND